MLLCIIIPELKMYCFLIKKTIISKLSFVDWEEGEEDQTDKQLWEDDWDDDNIEDDFSLQLRLRKK